MNNLLNLKSFFKFLSRNKLYTAIDIVGLSISLMFVILIVTYTVQQLSTDTYHEKGDRVYVLGSDNGLESAYRIGYRLQERYPEIEKVCHLLSRWYGPVQVEESSLKAYYHFTDTTFFSVFSFPLLQGDPTQALAAKNYAVISNTFANKAFGTADPMGKSIRLNDSVTVIVNGVMEDIKHSAIPYADLIVRIENVKYFNSTIDTENFANTGSVNLFILAKEKANLQAKADDMLAYFKEIFWIYSRGMYEKVTFTPIKEVFFSDTKSYTFEQGDKKLTFILMSVGILILLFAVINYINLTVAQNTFRAKEMATRRLLGSSRGELFARLIVESTLLTCISFLLGLFLAALLAPAAGELVNAKIYLYEMFTPLYVGAALVLILIIGLLSGLLPAVVISNAKPIEVVRGGFRRQTKMVFSRFFITFQHVITMILIAVSITMVAQLHHLIHAPLGYNTHGIMNINVYSISEQSKVKLLASELAKLPCVVRVAQSKSNPFEGGNNNSTQYEGRNISFQIIDGDSTFFSMLGFTILRDNHLTGGDGLFLNEQALKEMDLAPEATSFMWDKPTAIAGIIKDFQLRNITGMKCPMLMHLYTPGSFEPWNLLPEVQGDLYTAQEQIKQVYEQVIGVEFDGKYIDRQIEESFVSEQRTSTIVSIFAGIAILISLLGTLAMSTYFIQQREQEVALRKVLGSSNKEILIRLIRTFLSYVLIAFVLAVPISWYFMSRWLHDYSYRIELTPLIFIVAGLFCLLISFCTVFTQSYRAATRNPVEGLKQK